jgi:hypothetical protein
MHATHVMHHEKSVCLAVLPPFARLPGYRQLGNPLLKFLPASLPSFRDMALLFSQVSCFVEINTS